MGSEGEEVFKKEKDGETKRENWFQRLNLYTLKHKLGFFWATEL